MPSVFLGHGSPMNSLEPKLARRKMRAIRRDFSALADSGQTANVTMREGPPETMGQTQYP
jgi:hypothetical protein